MMSEHHRAPPASTSAVRLLGQPDLGSLLLTLAIAAAAIDVAWPWGPAAMVAAALGAAAAGLAVSLRLRPRGGGLAAPVATIAVVAPTIQGNLVVDGSTALARAIAAGRFAQPAEASRTIFIDHSTDAETAAAIERRLIDDPGAILVAQIRDPGLRRAVGNRLVADAVKPRPRLFGLDSVVARDVIAKERLFEQIHWRDQTKLHAVVIGFGALGRACLAEAVLAGIAGDLAPPRITIIDPDAARVRAVLADDMPELEASAEIAVVSAAGSALSDALAAVEAAVPVTAIFLCLLDEMARVEAATVLTRLQGREVGARAPLFLMSTEPFALSRLIFGRGDAADLARRVVVADDCLSNPDLLTSVSTQDDATAERLHDNYRRRFGGSGPSSLPWADLSEPYRAANRAAVRHLPQKLWTAGVSWPGASSDPGAVVPEAFASIVEPYTTSTGEDALMRRLARLEHDRWCAERRLAGWRFGSRRDDARLLHPSLIAFDDPRLSDEEIAKDIDHIRFMLGAVARPDPAGASAPMTLGVARVMPPTVGIALDDALSLLAEEPWRPVTILCGLSQPADGPIVRRLLEAIRAAGRPVRLIVPALASRDDRAVRPASVADLMAEPECRVVPVVGGHASADDWIDPSSAAEEDELIASYIARRATAIIDPAGAGPAAVDATPLCARADRGRHEADRCVGPDPRTSPSQQEHRLFSEQVPHP